MLHRLESQLNHKEKRKLKLNSKLASWSSKEEPSRLKRREKLDKRSQHAENSIESLDHDIEKLQHMIRSIKCAKQ